MSERARIADLLRERFPDVHFKVINPADKPEEHCPRDALLVSWVDGPEHAPVSAALRPLTQSGIQLVCCRDITCERCGQPGLRSPCLNCLPMTDDEVAVMPWRRNLMTREELAAWLASRKEAGRAIDIETCELGKWKADDCDPYGIREMIEPGYQWMQIGTNRFVRSPDSRGWIHEGDLPTEKFRAMYDRIIARVGQVVDRI